MYLFFLFTSLFLFYKCFMKKLLVLLSLELCMMSLICLYMNFSFLSLGVSSFFSSMFFFTFMVLDSVMGLCILISSCRNSSIFNNFNYF